MKTNSSIRRISCVRNGLFVLSVAALAVPLPASARTQGASTSSIPGSLPRGFQYPYTSGFRGWPVAPLHREHPIRSPFLDPRGGGYHFGVDIAVDDRRPERGAPPGRTHRVYAVDDGRAHVRDWPRRCSQRKLQVGLFSYWHVDPTVHEGEQVRAGQPIGWTCLGYWHLHFAEWRLVSGDKVWVNPLHRGGKLVPYKDATVPVIRALRFFTPERRAWRWLSEDDTATALPPIGLHGLVELRARVEDPETFTGWLGRLDPHAPGPAPPYRLAVRIADAAGRSVLHRVTFQSDRLPETPFTVHYAPGTLEDVRLRECIARSEEVCVREHWYRVFSRHHLEYWNTRTVPNGEYSVTVTAWDLHGHRSSARVTVVVANS